jgi:DNA-directed RNA polymerase specialized sigma24 family protein
MHLDDVLTELVEHSGDRLLRVAYQLTHDAAAAQDLVQEALLRYYEGLADPEIATLLGCRDATVRSLASRGLAAMRPLVAAASAEEEQT